MAPNASGIRHLDAEKLYDLNSHVFFNISQKFLLQGGSLILKFWQLPELNTLRGQLQQHFSNVKVFKPAASRHESSEVYFVAKNYFLPKT